MKVKGFYTGQSSSSEDAKLGTEIQFINCYEPKLKKVFKKCTFTATETKRNEWHDEESCKQNSYRPLKGYDTYFVLDLPDANMKEGTKAFRELEELISVALEPIDKKFKRMHHFSIDKTELPF